VALIYQKVESNGICKVRFEQKQSVVAPTNLLVPFSNTFKELDKIRTLAKILELLDKNAPMLFTKSGTLRKVCKRGQTSAFFLQISHDSIFGLNPCTSTTF